MKELDEKEVQKYVNKVYWASVKLHARHKFYLGLGVLNPADRSNFDMRKKLDKEVYRRINILFKSKQYLNDIEKAKENLHKKYPKPKEYKNVLDNPIVKDYINSLHKGAIRYIYDDHIHYWVGRNHWAKNEKDIRILAILKEHFLKKNKK